ncbi:uncharacterized protein T551_00305 [Pneumocystis jirovecii RU7]|uniref:ERCC4 domain-containing protein n=1 Tax=Pneumocystis jirovecii (strain RU7) TaxID=1408657 RepID=A0A0W4ZWS8_PNEJ7|nr:uncharacterized protein T551_00305 [Pneumocystis jirovecii RU7]KTW32820.1 hypothetical protein T551_00305 [Pneumocystis jirovecii RU7]
MANKKADIADDFDIPIVIIEDSPECEKLYSISSKKSEKKKGNCYEKDTSSVMGNDSQIDLERIKSDENEQSIIDISSSSISFTDEHDEIRNLDSEDAVEEEILDSKRYSPHTSSILSTVDEFLLNIMKSTSAMDSEACPEYLGTSSNSKSKNNYDPKNVTIIDQKVLKNTRKNFEKKRLSALRNVNKLKSKKECIKEIIVDIDKNILSSPLGSILSDLLKKSECEFNEWSSPIPNLIFWKRKVVAEYDEKLGYFVPIPEVIRPEQHVLIYMKASELLKIESDSSMDELIQRLMKEFPKSKILFMIESIDALLKKIKNDRNRRYADVIRANIELNNLEKNNLETILMPSEEIDEKIENMMLRLQLVHNTFIVNTSSVENSAEWIYVLTGDISTIPYKLKMKLQLSSSFCMESGQIKTGVDPKDTYFKLLQMIYKVTPQIANVIIEKYPKISYLVSAFRENGPEALSNLMIGNLMKRKIGPVLSKRIFHAFMTSDSTAYVI